MENSKNEVKKFGTIFDCGLVALTLLFTLIKITIDYNDKSWVNYNSRTYRLSNREIDDRDKDLVASVKATGIKTKGMEVYDVQGSGKTSTVILLKTSDVKFLMYGLVGGP